MLNVLAEAFLTEMKYVFGDVIAPKCHYLVHYARLIEMYGPVHIATTLSNRRQFGQGSEFSSQRLHEFEEM